GRRPATTAIPAAARTARSWCRGARRSRSARAGSAGPARECENSSPGDAAWLPPNRPRAGRPITISPPHRGEGRMGATHPSALTRSPRTPGRAVGVLAARRAPPEGSRSVDHVVAAVPHAGLERALEALVRTEPLVRAATHPAGSSSDGCSRTGPADRRAHRSARRRPQESADRAPHGGFLRRASRRLLSELAALLLVLGNSAGGPIVVGVARGLVAAHGRATDDSEEVNETHCGSMHGSLPSRKRYRPDRGVSRERRRSPSTHMRCVPAQRCLRAAP